MKVPISKPYLDDKEAEAVNKVLKSGWLVQGPKVAELERMFCQYTSAKFANATTSCTTALHLALVASGIGPGDEILVPSFTFIASANAVEYTGAKPVFIDIDVDTFNIDVQKVAQYLEHTKKYGKRVRAIMPVHLFGLCADMDAVMKLAQQYKLYVIEDAACALGSLYKLKHAGTFGDAGCFSFHPRKPITTGEGGMLITDNPEIASKVQSLRDHGAAVSDLARHEKDGSLLPAFDILGYNYRMTDIQGAIGIEQMKKFSWIVGKRIERARRYDRELKDVECLQTPFVSKDCKHTYQSYVVLLRDSKTKGIPSSELEKFHSVRNVIMAKLNEKGIATRQGTSAVHTLGYYRRKYDLSDDDCPLSLQADCLTIALPLYPQMTDEEQSYVIDNLLQVVKGISL